MVQIVGVGKRTVKALTSEFGTDLIGYCSLTPDSDEVLVQAMLNEGVHLLKDKWNKT